MHNAQIFLHVSMPPPARYVLLVMSSVVRRATVFQGRDQNASRLPTPQSLHAQTKRKACGATIEKGKRQKGERNTAASASACATAASASACATPTASTTTATNSSASAATRTWAIGASVQIGPGAFRRGGKITRGPQMILGQRHLEVLLDDCDAAGWFRTNDLCHLDALSPGVAPGFHSSDSDSAEDKDTKDKDPKDGKGSRGGDGQNDNREGQHSNSNNVFDRSFHPPSAEFTDVWHRYHSLLAAEIQLVQKLRQLRASGVSELQRPAQTIARASSSAAQVNGLGGNLR